MGYMAKHRLIRLKAQRDRTARAEAEEALQAERVRRLAQSEDASREGAPGAPGRPSGAVVRPGASTHRLRIGRAPEACPCRPKSGFGQEK
jgi:hypothetical protein